MAQIGTIARFEVSGEILNEDVLALLAIRDAGVPGAEMDKAEEGDFYAAWDLLRDQWQAIRSEVADFDTERLRRRWIIPLLELLGHKPEYLRSHPTLPSGASVPITHRTHTIPIWLADFAEKPDDRPTEGKRRRSKHEIFQEFLDMTEDDWGILCTGRTIRLLTDYHKTLTRNFVEADLESIFDELDLDAFRIVWRLFRASAFIPRAKGVRDIERIRDHARQQGTEIGKELRKQVVEAVVTLANGFLEADESGELLQAVESDSEGPMRLYQSVLRVVYRLLFLLYVENKPGWTPAQDPRWASGYSISRLRAMAEDPGSYRAEGEDLWEGLKVTFRIIRGGCTLFNEPISPYGGELFDDERLWHLKDSPLANAPLLRALYLLTIFERREKKVSTLHRVNFRNLQINALGSVYESLLEERPILDAEGRFGFYHRAGKGNKRKETGSYYTPPELVAELIKTALLPVIEDRLKEVCRSVGLQVGMSEHWLLEVINDVAIGKQRIQGAHRLAAGDGLSGGVSHSDEGTPEGGGVRADRSDSPGRELDPSQHSRGERTGNAEGLRPVPEDVHGQPPGAGDAPSAGETSWLHERGSDGGDGNSGDVRRETVDSPHPESTALEDLQTHRPTDLPTLLRQAILGISVVDPACGSGAFLIQALDALAEALLKVQLGDEQPSELQLRVARRDVAIHCIHGVDMNPMAVELCKFTIWLHVAHPKFPLSYLEPLIRSGNSLVGVPTKAQIEEAKRVIAEENARIKLLPTYKPKDLQTYTGWEGFDLEPSKLTKVPDEAFSPVGDDDKTYAKSIQAANKSERAGQLRLTEGQAEDFTTGRLAVYRHMQEIEEDDPEAIREKTKRFDQYLKSGAYRLPKRFADAWCSAFFWPMKSRSVGREVGRSVGSGPADLQTQRPTDLQTWSPDCVPTQAELNKLHPAKQRASNATPVDAALVAEVERRAEALQFFHWELEFPDVFEKGGFDVVLGNPPWKKTDLKEQEWFAGKNDAIVDAPTKAKRTELIEGLRTTDPALDEAFALASHEQAARSKFLKESNRYPLTGKGKMNLYALFAETDRGLTRLSGRAGFICPTGIATDDTTKDFFGAVAGGGELAGLYDFSNKEKLFDIGTLIKFVLLTIARAGGVETEYRFFLTNPAQIADPRRRVGLTAADILLMNPNTRTAPVLRTRQDADLLRFIYQRVPVLVRERPDLQTSQPTDLPTSLNPWGIRYQQGHFNMSSDSRLFKTADDLAAMGARFEDGVWVIGEGDDPVEGIE